MGVFNWIINLAPVLTTVYGWVRSLFNVKVIAFLLLKAIIFFIFYKYMPLLFGRFFQWIYDLGSGINTGVDLSFLSTLTSSPITGLGAWFYYTLKLDVCFRIMIAGATARLGLKPLPFMNR
jgi:hypothetical protein